MHNGSSLAPSLDDIRSSLARHAPRTGPFRPLAAKHAAVAMILAGDDGNLRLCFIRRAERDGDPWSGHMAFPGGRAQADDASPRATAERETQEELGLGLGDYHLIAPLSEMPVRIGGRDIGMTLSPFVYHLDVPPERLHPNHEVAAAYWVPLEHLWDPANSTHLDMHRAGRRLLYPAIRFGDTVIWGLTYRVLTLFSDVLEHPLPHLEEIPGLGR